MREQPFASPGEALAHFGVKGMKWGVRKNTEVTVDGKTEMVSRRKARKLDAKWEKNINSRRKFVKFNNQVADEINGKIEAFNNDPRWAGKDLSKDRKLEKQYLDEFNTMTYDARHKAIKDVYGMNNPTGTKIMVPVHGGDERMIVSVTPEGQSKKRVAHADIEAEFYLEWDEKGFIVKVTPVVIADEEMAQAAERGAEFLKHYGVKGMRWGVRKKDETGGDGKVGADGKVGIDPVSATYIAIFLGLTVKTAWDLRRAAVDSGKKYQKKNANVPWKKKPELAKPAPPMDVDKLYDQVVKPTNPNYPKSGYKMNCRRCTLAYEMRRRGMDVQATKSHFATGQDQHGLMTAIRQRDRSHESIWGEKQISTPYEFARATPEKRAEAIFDKLGKEPDGSRGELGVGWQFGGGHSMAYEVVRGKPVIFDTQSAKTYRDPSSLKEFATVMTDAAHTRTDNVKLDESYLRRWAFNHD